MRQSYFNVNGHTTVDISPHTWATLVLGKLVDDVPVRRGYYINRIYTPLLERRKGYARQVMKAVIDDADREGVTLWLEINPYGSMTLRQLQAWYRRLGFKKIGKNLYERKPKENDNDARKESSRPDRGE